MAQLFRPPTRTNVCRLEGSLTYSFDTAKTVWRAGGVWQAQETPPYEVLAAADMDASGNPLYLLGHPAVVSDAMAAELEAAFPGSCTPIEA